MSASEGKEEASILEDPNALRHMDALFDVLRKPAERKSRGSPAVAVSAAAELAACGAPAADMEFLLDALFAVVQTDPAAGSGGKGGGSRVAKTAAKSWRERGLPASFFDSSRSCTNSSDGGSTEIAGAPGAGIGGAGKAPSSVPSPVSLAKVQASNSVTASPGLSPVPVVLVANAGATESYTFYIDKHLQCRVNMEPTLERRRRLARGRVQKYRSIKRRRKGRSTDDVLPETACS